MYIRKLMFSKVVILIIMLLGIFGCLDKWKIKKEENSEKVILSKGHKNPDEIIPLEKKDSDTWVIKYNLIEDVLISYTLNNGSKEYIKKALEKEGFYEIKYIISEKKIELREIIVIEKATIQGDLENSILTKKMIKNDQGFFELEINFNKKAYSIVYEKKIDGESIIKKIERELNEIGRFKIILKTENFEILEEKMEEDNTKLYLPVDPEKAKELISSKENIVIIDVRTSGEFNNGYIEGAINIDYYKTDIFKEELLKLDKNKPFIIYCRSGNRSSSALDIFKDQMFKEVYEIKGGIIEWIESGYDVVKK